MSYDIGISEIDCTERYFDATGNLSIQYDAVAAARPTKCANPKCLHEIKPHIHDTKHNAIKDIKSEGKIVVINLAVRRYKCPDCGYVFPDEFTFYAKNDHITARLKSEFVNRCLNGETFSYIAHDYGVDDKTVAKAFRDYAGTHLEEALITETPAVLGIDEAHIDDHYRLVLTDVARKKLIDIKKNNHKNTVKAYLRTLDKNVCKVVTMDFAKGYAYAVMKVLPDAMIVIDRFHVIQLVNTCVDNVRKDLQNEYRKQGYDIRLFKRSKTLFMSNLEDLSDKSLETMQRWFDLFPALYTAYMVKETFREIYHDHKNKKYEDAEVMFDKWLADLPDYHRFNSMRTTFTERKEHILNFFKCGFTNAYTESVNNLIKKTEKAGRGYKFEVLRERCILSINKAKTADFKYKNTVYVKAKNEEAFRNKIADYEAVIANMKKLLDDGMLSLAEAKNPTAVFDGRFCKAPALAVARRVSFVHADFTED
jgi:transposase